MDNWRRERSFSQWLEVFYTTDSIPHRAPASTIETMGQQDWDRLQEIMYIVEVLLPPVQREVILLCIIRGTKQRHVAAMLGISQEMCAYNLKRGVFRIRMWIRHRQLDLQRMEEMLSNWITPKQTEAVMCYLHYHDQAKVGRKFGVSQAAISSRITISHRILRRIVRTPWAAKDRAELRLYLSVLNDLVSHNSLLHIQSKKKLVDRSNTVSNADPPMKHR